VLVPALWGGPQRPGLWQVPVPPVSTFSNVYYMCLLLSHIVIITQIIFLRIGLLM
jgi:hypothetical protein